MKTENKRRKGFMYILEVLIAIGIMMSAVVFLFGSAPETPEFSDVIIGQHGIDALTYLDNKGVLRQYVYESNEAMIEDSLTGILPNNIAFETEICTSTCDSTNVTGTRTLITFDYFVSGYKSIYSAKKVRLWLWERF